MTKILRIGISPCPNDTFIFHALLHGLVEAPARFDPVLADVEVLNGMAGRGEADVCKLSVAAAAGVLDEYVLLRSGGAMGYGVGPILVAREGVRLDTLDRRRVAIPGRMTTANLLFGLCCREKGVGPERVEMVFDEVMPAVNRGDVAAGVVIHEGRFTFAEHGLTRLLDLGDWWERSRGLPIPLGAIAVRRSLGPELIRELDEAVRRSILHARENPEAGREWIRSHAQEMDEGVIARHIETFVTDYSLDVGEEGERAVTALLREACREAGRRPPQGGAFD